MLQRYWDQSRIALQGVEPGPMKPGWLRLKVTGCGICGSDLHRHKRTSGVTPGQGTPGHELVDPGSGIAMSFTTMDFSRSRLIAAGCLHGGFLC